MMLKFTVGINIAGKHESVTVAAEDALIAALKVKCERPDALINYVRRRNKRGDLRHPHGSIAAKGRRPMIERSHTDSRESRIIACALVSRLAHSRYFHATTKP